MYPLNYPYIPYAQPPRATVLARYQGGQEEPAAAVPPQGEWLDHVVQPEKRNHSGKGSRLGARRTRGQTTESEMEEMNRRKDELQVSVREARDEQNAHWNTYNAQRLDDLQWRTEQSAHWATYYTHREEDLQCRNEQRQVDMEWRAQQDAHWATYHANQQAELEWRQQMQNAWYSQFPPPPPQ